MPKCLVKVGGASILDHQIDALRAGGIGDVLIVGGYRYEQLKAHIMEMPASRRPQLIRNPFWETTGSIGSVWVARGWLRTPFCLVNGDTIFEAPLVKDALAAMKPGTNLVIEHGPPEDDDMRVAVTRDRIVTVSKLLSPFIGSARSLGIVLSPDSDGGPYPDALEAVMRQPRGEHAYHHDVIDRIAQRLTVHAVTVQDYAWQEIDRPEDVRAWEARVLRDAA
jgi:choline kinase